MQYDRAAQLQREWGNKPCDHPDLDKEYYLGAQTGDYVCTQCGRTFTPTQAKEIEARQKK